MVPLESCRLFADLSAAEMAEIRQVVRELSYPHDQIIFQEGDDGNGLFLVKSGRVQILTVISTGERRAISNVNPGETFGEMAVIDSDKRSASAAAEGETEVYFIPREDLFRIMEHSPALMRSLVREVSRRLREFNRQYLREVIQSERLALVGRFARSIVHDIKNPLNIIGLAADMAGMETAAPELRKTAKQRIRKQVERISNMVNELIEFTRGSQTSVGLVLADYSAFVNLLIEEIRAEVSFKKVELEIQNPPPVAKITMNPQRLSRVFYNLVHNATDAMPNGGKIMLRFQVREKEVFTEIEDTGPGIPTELLGQIFEPFFTHGKVQGTGLGLSITQRIIEDHHGKIGVGNRPGGGAIFSFTLPIKES